MKTQLMTITLSGILVITSLSGCSQSAPRINPGYLEVSESITSHTARITNIVQLSEKEAPVGRMLLGGIAGAIVAGALTDGKSDLVQDIATDIGGDIGAEAARDKYGKTIYKLTLALNDGSVKQIHVRGGAYIVGRHAKITVDKKSGNITSLVALKT
jgi:hypothetical protein